MSNYVLLCEFYMSVKFISLVDLDIFLDYYYFFDPK